MTGDEHKEVVMRNFLYLFTIVLMASTIVHAKAPTKPAPTAKKAKKPPPTLDTYVFVDYTRACQGMHKGEQFMEVPAKVEKQLLTVADLTRVRVEKLRAADATHLTGKDIKRFRRGLRVFSQEETFYRDEHTAMKKALDGLSPYGENKTRDREAIRKHCVDVAKRSTERFKSTRHQSSASGEFVKVADNSQRLKEANAALDAFESRYANPADR